MIIRRTFRALAAAATAVSLAGCISLFPKADPVTLYRFSAPAGAAASEAAPQATVLRAPTDFPRIAASDRILTVNGPESATIANARWATPAQIMFDETLTQAFDRDGRIRLATRGEPAPADAVLRVEVRTFEARYVNGPESAPVAVVEARATLTSLQDRKVVATRMFTAEQAAGENRVGPIVAAYEAAANAVQDEIVRWTAENVRGGAPAAL